MAYRFRDPTPVFDNLLGTDPAPGGQAFFYEIGTNTPKDTFQDYDLTTPNTNPIILTSAGRFPFPVWMDGDYTYELKAADGSSIINPTDIRPEIAPGQAIPDPLGHDGEYLTVVAGEVAWSGPVWKLPDPTGSAGQMVVVDSSGTDFILQAQPAPPEIPEPEIVITTAPASFRAGVSDNTTKFYIQAGSGSAPASGTENTQVAVTFAEAFASAPWHISIEQTHNGVTSLAAVPSYTITTRSATGFTVRFSTEENSDFAGWSIISAVPFTYMAVGTKTVT